MGVPDINDVIRVLGVLIVISSLCGPFVAPLIRSFRPVHQWVKRNPYSRQCARCGFRQDIYADAYGLGYDSEGHQLVEYRDEHWVPDTPKVCNDEIGIMRSSDDAEH
jgi:hypothetical protein